MRQKREDNSDTSVSFLDVIACAFGAIALLVLILPIGDFGVEEDTSATLDYGRSLWALDNLTAEVAILEQEITEYDELATTLSSDLTTAADKTRHLQRLIDRTRNTSNELQERLAAITANRRIAEQAPPPAAADLQIDTELAGIPVDSEYIAFVVDTSGSMRPIWKAVMAEITNVLSIYPEVRGFQILNDQGSYLFGDKKKRWIPDTPANRQTALRNMRNWKAFSTSNPAPGILAALNDLHHPNRKMAIFVFGDDYASNDFIGFLHQVERGLAVRRMGSGSFRIHAIGFSNRRVAASQINFAVLMRELTRRYQGAFLALPESKRPARVSLVRGQGNPG